MKLLPLTLCATAIAAVIGLGATSTVAQAQTYKVEPTHTFVTWEAKHFDITRAFR